MRIAAPPIIVCSEWGARRPRSRPQLAGRPVRSLFHHTAGHAPEPASQAYDAWAQACEYARALQHYHMDVNGWNDSGHNFLVMRSGVIVQGRWGTVTAIEHGRMVWSAHCPGQNDQPGVEHEHVDEATLTPLQLAASVWLHAWIFDRCGIRPTEIYGHRIYYNTACPGALTADVPAFRLAVAAKLNEHGRGKPARLGLLARARFGGIGKLV